MQSSSQKKSHDKEQLDVSWEGRCWMDASLHRLNDRAIPKFRFLTYRQQAHFKAAFMHHSVHKNVDQRGELLMQELTCYDADIICFQDIDQYREYWYPQLMKRGYDTVYKQRTQLKEFHYEGVMTAWKRERFQLVHTINVEFNSAIKEDSKGVTFRERSLTDDVGIIVILQPMKSDDLLTSLCVANAMLPEAVAASDIRAAHAGYLTQIIEKANAPFQAPVLIGISLNDVPGSLAYTLLRSGRSALSAQVPASCTNITAQPFSRGSATLKWLPPKMTIADPPLLSYEIAWRPGGSSTLGFTDSVIALSGDCIRYAEQRDSHGRRKIIALPELQFTVTKLVAEVPYEFRIRGINEIGQGIWSQVTQPMVLPNPVKAMSMPPLHYFVDHEAVNAAQELMRMNQEDWNIHLAYIVDPVNAPTQLTPRLLDGAINHHISRGRILPAHSNSRHGWKDSLRGIPDPIMTSELQREYVTSKSLLRDREGFKQRSLNHYDDTGLALKSPFGGFNYNREYNDKIQSSIASFDIRDGDGLILDAKEVMYHIGAPNPRQVHAMTLRSAYECHGCAGEGMISQSVPRDRHTLGVDLTDFIFYSSMGLAAHRILSLPTPSAALLTGEAPEAPLVTEDTVVMGSAYHSEIYDNQVRELYDKVWRSRQIDASIDEDGKEIDVDDNGNQQQDEIKREKVLDSECTSNDIRTMKRLLQTALALSHSLDDSTMTNSKEKEKKMGFKQLRDNTKKIRTTSPKKGGGSAKERKQLLSSGKSRVFFGGRSVPLIRKNPLRQNYLLPNASFPSTHFALGVDILIDENELATIWRRI